MGKIAGEVSKAQWFKIFLEDGSVDYVSTTFTTNKERREAEAKVLKQKWDEEGIKYERIRYHPHAIGPSSFKHKQVD